MVVYNEDYSAFDINNKYSNIILWGAGKSLHYFFLLMKECIDLKTIKCVVDNNQDKTGQRVVIDNLSYPIVNPDYIKRYNEDTIIIITAINYKDILFQIQSYGGLKIKECCYMYDVYENTETVLDAQRYYPKTYKQSKSQLIPKKIHYCWFGNNSIPDSVEMCIDSWKKYCPDYEILKWDDSNYDYTFNKYMVQAYENKKWAFVSDVARLDIVYRYGGIYLDTDVELIKGLDDFLFQNNFFGIENKLYVSNGLGFGARQNDLVVKELLSLYENRLFITEGGKMDLTPCPHIQKTVFAKYGYPFDGNYYSTDLLTVVPSRVLNGKSFFTGKLYCNEHTVSIHHYDASWK